MEVDMILPLMAGASGVFAGCAVLYSKIRPRFPVRVNCWFCNKDTKVEFRYSDGWLCPSCEQYNGFTEDGDYNRDLPAQYCEALNTPPKYKINKIAEQSHTAPENGLCHTCNQNQTLKVRALADYTPIHPDNYDKEIDEYKKRLERIYALCRQCEATLHQTLGKQDSWLKPKMISWRLRVSSENKAHIIKSGGSATARVPFYLHLFHVMGLLISLALFMSNVHHLQQHSGMQIVSLNLGVELELYLEALYKFGSPLIISGLTLLLLAIFASGKETLLVSDAITSFVWVGLLALYSAKQLITVEDYNSLQVLISGAAVFFTLWTSLVPRNVNRTAMMMRPPQHNKSMMTDVSSSDVEDSRGTLNGSCFSNGNINNVTPPPAAPSSYHSGMTSTPIPPRVLESPRATSLDATLESLKISTPYKTDQRIRPSTPFSAKLLFSERPGYNPKVNDTYCIQRNVVSPSRLSTKNITQSSWVAGGYWGQPVSPAREFPQHGQPKISSASTNNQSYMSPLSRSSSQSSGFVSHSSGMPPYGGYGPCSLPNSRHGSTCGDHDRGSVLSEPAYKSWGHPVTLYPSDSASQCSYSRHRGQGKSDAQSLYSCASVFSEGSQQKTPPSPVTSNPYMYHEVSGNLSMNSSNTSSSRKTSRPRDTFVSSKDLPSKKSPSTGNYTYRNPWVAFFLGMSIAANGFLAFLLFIHFDIHSLIGMK